MIKKNGSKDIYLHLTVQKQPEISRNSTVILVYEKTPELIYCLQKMTHLSTNMFVQKDLNSTFFNLVGLMKSSNNHSSFL